MESDPSGRFCGREVGGIKRSIRLSYGIAPDGTRTHDLYITNVESLPVLAF